MHGACNPDEGRELPVTERAFMNGRFMVRGRSHNGSRLPAQEARNRVAPGRRRIEDRDVERALGHDPVAARTAEIEHRDARARGAREHGFDSIGLHCDHHA